MKKFLSYTGQWFSDWYSIFARELKHIFSDSGVLIVFFLAGLAYPIIYGIVYSNGNLDDMPVAIVDDSGSAAGRKFVRALDATRELQVSRTCMNMAEAENLMRDRQVNGIVWIHEDFEDNSAASHPATVSTYADMSSMIYYKNLTMGVNMAMLDGMHAIQEQKFPAAGMDGKQVEQLIHPIEYEENIPYNRAFSYSIFFMSAILLVIIQQTMYFGVSMLSGTMREENRHSAAMPWKLSGRGISRTVFGRGLAYWLIYIAIGVYIMALIPKIIGMPQNCPFGDIFILLLFFVTACVVFSFTFSTLIRHRETVFILFLLMSVVCLFLTGFSWPQSSFPLFWKWFSCIFPSTFAVRAFMNMNTAGAGLAMAEPQILALTIQIIVYYILSCAAVFLENRVRISGTSQE